MPPDGVVYGGSRSQSSVHRCRRTGLQLVDHVLVPALIAGDVCPRISITTRESTRCVSSSVVGSHLAYWVGVLFTPIDELDLSLL